MTQEESNNPWQTLSSDMKYDNPWITVTEYQVINPSGGRGIYGKVHFKNLAIGIVPLDNHLNTWLVGQYRFTLGQWSWEIPEGGGSLQDEPLLSARRELKEETGLTAGRWQEILKLHTSNSVTDETGYVFLAEDLLEGKAELEDTEAGLQVMKLPLCDAVRMVENGEITDSISVMALLLVARMKGV